MAFTINASAPNSFDGFHTFRLGNRMDLDLHRCAQEGFRPKQRAKAMGHEMVIQIFTRLPLPKHAEAILVFNVAKNSIAEAARFFTRRRNHRLKRLHKLPLFFRKNV